MHAPEMRFFPQTKGSCERLVLAWVVCVCDKHRMPEEPRALLHYLPLANRVVYREPRERTPPRKFVIVPMLSCVHAKGTSQCAFGWPTLRGSAQRATPSGTKLPVLFP